MTDMMKNGQESSGKQLPGPSTPKPEGVNPGPLALTEIACSVRGVLGELQSNVVAIGRNLLRAKDILGHGKFLPWIESEFGWTARTAQNFMNVADRLGDKCEIVSHLGPTTLYMLAAPSTPNVVVEQIVSMAGRGEKVSVKTVRGMIRAARPGSGHESRANRGKGADERGSGPDTDNDPAGTPSSVEQMSQQLHGLLKAKLGHEPQLFERAAYLLRRCDPVRVATLIDEDLVYRG